jgi:Tfp pilus assembly protein PilE
MTITIIIVAILICLVFYFILNDKINKIKKEYVKSDLISEMQEIITYFNQEAERNISLLEDKIKEIDTKTKKLEKLKKSLEEKFLIEINKNPKKQNETELTNLDDKSWQQKAYVMFENGFSYEEISEKLKKNVGEIQFAISYFDMKEKIKPSEKKMKKS